MPRRNARSVAMRSRPREQLLGRPRMDPREEADPVQRPGRGRGQHRVQPYPQNPRLVFNFDKIK